MLPAHLSSYLTIYSTCSKQNYPTVCESITQFPDNSALFRVRYVKDTIPSYYRIVLLLRFPFADVSMYKIRIWMARSCILKHCFRDIDSCNLESCIEQRSDYPAATSTTNVEGVVFVGREPYSHLEKMNASR